MPEACPQLIITVGIPGSGKSTVLANVDGPVVHPDGIRAELTGDVEDQSRNADVFRIAFARLRRHLAAGETVYLDATNVDRSRRNELREIAREAGAVPVVWRVTTPHEISRARNAARDRTVPEEVMDRMIEQFDSTCSVDALYADGWNVLAVDPAAEHAS